MSIYDTDPNRLKEYKADIFTRLFYLLPASVILLFPLNLISFLAGKCADSSFSRFLIPFFITFFGVKVEDFTVGTEDKKSLNAFFMRPLKDELKTFSESATTLISPAEGYYYHFPYVPEDEFRVKSNLFTVKDFIGNDQIAEKFKNPYICVVYLTPKNYHRFHVPLTCKIIAEPNLIKGELLSVNFLAMQKFPNLYSINERVIYAFEDAFGNPFVMSAVGATMVGSMGNRLKETKKGTMLQKGIELGDFKFGGSTIVMVFEKENLNHDEKFKAANTFVNACAIRYGETIGEINGKIKK
ncbi:MAG: phosphatidylserine decarboxylase [Nitrospinae bacterium]|nr:phosphatidylserine decarboxylase [Nitrospinota bacterium]